MAYRVRMIALVNFCVSIALQFAWLAHACVAGQPAHDRFLLFQSGRSTPAWACVFIGPLVLAGYFVSHPARNLAARLGAAVVGLGGLLWLLAVRYPLSLIYGDPPLAFNAETVVGVYVLISYAMLAAFWKRRG